MKKILIILIIITLNIIIFSANSTQKSQDIPVNVTVLPHIEISDGTIYSVWYDLYHEQNSGARFNNLSPFSVNQNYTINPTTDEVHALYLTTITVKANIRTELHAYFRLNEDSVLDQDFYRPQIGAPKQNDYVSNWINGNNGDSGMVAFLSHIGNRTGNVDINGGGVLPLNLGTTEYQEGSQETLLVSSCCNYGNTEADYTFGFYLKFGEEDTFALKAGEITIGWFEIIVTPIMN